jgi:hypothetical protein
MYELFYIALAVGALLFLIQLAATRTRFESQSPRDYAQETPVFDIRERLDGPLLCEGIIYGPTGRVSSRFVARMEGAWEGNKASLRETFHYSSGTVQERKWNLSLDDKGAITATADDIRGTGKGQQMGNAVVLNYRIKLPKSAGGWVLDVVDWMYLLDNGTIMNRSQFRKFGIKVAELVATMRPVE